MAGDRQVARMKALQALYQFFFRQDQDLSYQEVIDQSFTGEEDDVEGQAASDWLQTLVEGVVEEQDKLDNVLSKHLKNWTLSQLNRVDTLILRMGIYELLYTDVPAAVVLNEMVELSKTFSNEESSRLINGVLVSVAKETEKGEDIR